MLVFSPMTMRLLVLLESLNAGITTFKIYEYLNQHWDVILQLSPKRDRTMPLSYPIITQPVMDTIVREVIKKALLHLGCFGISMDVRRVFNVIGKAHVIESDAAKSCYRRMGHLCS